ncbi:MAG: zinc metallopeptidase [Marinilabiliaceae bacterium]|nr:zinc metallopeptidase [Marinilabiliaceae bacterium]
MFSPGLLLIFVVFLILSTAVNWQLKSRFKKYSKIASSGYKTGREIAEKMLYDNGIRNVRVVSVNRTLSDHYNPTTKTVNLSPEVYNGNSIAAAAVAAHECGHAIQDAQSYSMLNLRTALVPLQNVSSKILNVIFIAMFFGAFMFQSIFSYDLALQIIIACYAIFTLFAFITLPVEIDASKRALTWLNSSGTTVSDTHGYAKDALKWASYTYLVAALSSLATLLYYLMILLNRRD